MTPNRNGIYERTPDSSLVAAFGIVIPLAVVLLAMFVLGTLAVASAFGYASDSASSPPGGVGDPPASPIIVLTDRPVLGLAVPSGGAPSLSRGAPSFSSTQTPVPPATLGNNVPSRRGGTFDGGRTWRKLNG